MFIIVGLGNPENQYKNTRHNIGFEVINKLAYDYNVNINKSKHRAHLGEGVICGKKVLLVKPQTYMNLSGESVGQIFKFYKEDISNLIVAYDDVNLPVGDIRVRESGSSGGQKGMKSIIEHLKTDVFTRIRIGIGEKTKGYDLADYVLSKFRNDEFDNMVLGVTKAGEAVEIILKDSVTTAMNKFNQKVKDVKQ